MSKPGAKKLDQIVSVTPGDIHIIMIPSPGGPVPTPIPHPCASIIKGKVASKVKVMGQPGAVKGSKSQHTPPHIPMGPGPFQKPPGNKGEIFMTGSMGVLYEGKKAAMLGDTAMMCSDPSDTPVGKVIGTAATVLVGGGSPGGGSATGTGSAAADKAIAAFMHQWISINMPPGAERDQAHRDVCTATGHPIDVATGKMFTRNIDLSLPGRIPFEFVRNYSSARSDTGTFGRSWRHSYEMQLIINPEFIAYRDQNGRFLAFAPIQVDETTVNDLTHIKLTRTNDAYIAELPDGLQHVFWCSEETHQTDHTITVPLWQIIDEFDNRIIFEYQKDILVCITDSVGRKVILNYNEQGYVSEIRLIADPSTRQPELIRSYRYSENGSLVAWQDAAGNTYRFEYTGHLMTRETDRNGYSFYFKYDQDGWCRETWGDGGMLQRRIDYDKNNNRTRVVDSLGYITTYEWNEMGVVTKETDHHGNSWRFDFSESLQRTRVEDLEGNIWAYEYDDQGNMVNEETPEGAVREYAWNQDNRLSSYTDPLGNEWSYQYNKELNETRITNPENGITIEKKAANGDLVEVTEPDGSVSRYKYDSFANLTLASLPTGLQIESRYNTRGALIFESDNAGESKKVKYDAMSRASLIWKRDRGLVKLDRDAEGRIIIVTDAKRLTTEYEYGLFDNIKCINYPEVQLLDGLKINNKKAYQYDTENRVISVELPGKEFVKYDFDGQDRPMRISYPDGRVQSFVRNKKGFITQLFENGEQVYEQESDSVGRVLRRQTADGDEFNYEYNLLGQMVSAADDQHLVELEYDALGRLIQENSDYGNQSLRFTNNGNNIDSVYNDSLKLKLSVERSQQGTRLTAVRGSKQEFSLDYDALGRLNASRFGNGETHLRAYGNRLQPDSVNISSSVSKTNHREEYEYDEKNLLVTTKVNQKQSTQYERDSLNRLIGEVRSTTNTGQKKLTWGYDESGNRVLSTATDGRQFNNEFVKGNRPVKAAQERYDYDDRGRVVRRYNDKNEVTEFSWDSLGRLKLLITPEGDLVEYQYDAIGRRIRKSQKDKVTEFGWVGNKLVHENIDNDEQRQYIYHEGSNGPLGRFVANKQKGWQFQPIHSDIRGAPVRMSNASGDVIWQAELDPWGEIRSLQGNADDMPIRMSGQYYDAESGLHYNNARYYSTQSGSYLTLDPIGYDGGDNLYGYPADPICWIDPMGLSADDSCNGKEFGDNDLVDGPSAKGALRKLQQEKGGRLLTDVDGKSPDESWTQFSLDTLDQQVSTGGKVRFDLTHMTESEMGNVLKGTGEHGNKVTAAELRHINKNWDSFEGNTTFYRNGEVVDPPW